MSFVLGNAARQVCQRWRPVYGKFATLRGFAKPASAPKNPEIESNEPVQYFGSKAALWRAKQTREGSEEEQLWYQTYVVTASTAIFLLYFCAFREESDIDEKLGQSLFEHVPGLEEQQLVVSYQYNIEHKLPVKDIQERLTALGVDVKQINTK